MTVPLKNSKLWETERGHGPGKPYKTFKLRDPLFYGVKGAHVFRTEGNLWSWVYWDIAGHDFRPTSSKGFTTAELAGNDMIDALYLAWFTFFTRVEKLANGFN